MFFSIFIDYWLILFNPGCYYKYSDTAGELVILKGVSNKE